MKSENPKAILLEEAFRLGAICVNVEQPFRWASGYLMPIYNNNRLLLAHDSVRRLICHLFVECLTEQGYEAEVITGVATAGIPHATLIADRLDLPLHYVRSTAKDHGTGSLIEGLSGKDYRGAAVVLVEDVVSTGGSSLAAVQAIRAHGGRVLACLTIFTYGLSASRQAFADAGCPLLPLLDFNFLFEHGSRSGRLSPQQQEQLKYWYDDPFNWQADHNCQ